MTDALTEHNDIPKPHTDNDLSYDMARIALALDLIDLLLKSHFDAISAKANSTHQHAISEIVDLQNQLSLLAQNIANKADALVDLSDTNVADVSHGMLLQYLNDEWVSAVAKAQFFSIDPVSGLVANNVQSAIAELQLAKVTTSDIDAAINSVVNAAPGTLDTLNELAAALGDDPNFATTISGQIAGKADTGHTHSISNISGLQSALNGKLSTSGKAADSNKLDGLNYTQFVRSDANDTMSGSLTVTGNFTVHANLYCGKNGGGDSWQYFYDDNSNAWRLFGWDDSVNWFTMYDQHANGNYPIAKVATTSSTGTTSFPLGHIIAASYGSIPNRNGAYTLYLYGSNNDQYVNNTHGGPKGSTLSGTWRARGVAGSNTALFQRVA